jgi:hypothetical protein
MVKLCSLGALLASATVLGLGAPAMAASEPAPLPVARPEALKGAPEPAASPAATPDAPLPPSRPPGLEQAQPHAAAETEEEDHAAADCLERLTKLGLQAEPAPAIHNGTCGTEHPVKLSRLTNGVEVSPAVTVTCPVAEALGRWTLESVSGEADRLLGHGPKKILIGTSYECRSQNRQAGAKLSEHAFANAVDVMGFEFDKRAAIAIAPRADESPEALFQAAVRSKACAYFTTVLGPGSDAAHSNHLHLDLRGRRGTSRICQ